MFFPSICIYKGANPQNSISNHSLVRVPSYKRRRVDECCQLNLDYCTFFDEKIMIFLDSILLVNKCRTWFAFNFYSCLKMIFFSKRAGEFYFRIYVKMNAQDACKISCTINSGSLTIPSVLRRRFSMTITKSLNDWLINEMLCCAKTYAAMLKFWENSGLSDDVEADVNWITPCHFMMD